MRCATSDNLLSNPKCCYTTVGSRKEEALQQVQTVEQLGSHDPEDSVVLEVSVADKDSI